MKSVLAEGGCAIFRLVLFVYLEFALTNSLVIQFGGNCFWLLVVSFLIVRRLNIELNDTKTVVVSVFDTFRKTRVRQ